MLLRIVACAAISLLYALPSAAEKQYILTYQGKNIYCWFDSRGVFNATDRCPPFMDCLTHRIADEAAHDNSNTIIQQQRQNPVALIPKSIANSDIRAKAARDFPNNYSTQKFAIERDMDAYDSLIRYPSSPVTDEILQKALSNFYPGFSTIKFYLEREISAYNALQQ